MSATRRRTVRRLAVATWCTVIALILLIEGVTTGGAAPEPDRRAPAPTTSAVAANPVAGCGTASMRAGSTIMRSVQMRGVSRRYQVHIPSIYTGHIPMPLIIAYHGRAERAATFANYTGLSNLPAIVVYPMGLPGRKDQSAWQGAPYASPRADDVAFTREILRDLRTRACVDRSRTFAVGRSNGGGFVALLACRMSREFAGFATVSAAVYARSVAGCGSGPAISLIDFHGTADRTISYQGGTRFGERYLSSASRLRRWTQRAGCVDAPLTMPLTHSVDRLSWPLCGGLGSSVVHYRLRGGGHRWPAAVGGHGTGSVGGAMSATQLIWQFFLTRPTLGSS
ncbi:PHB depolymerase family esterase [Gordonia sp. PKS22-38]|uniref:PHB depolymerase family esterase n=1 Tax=Gordonia prachuapensis TaxID=3115651 RepID=A0ABU7MSH3_9ACTN|nr:PHB depolymerase family esterase [Gordonia sp. PKS22-38]